MQVSASDPSTTAIVWISPQVYAMLARRHMLQLMPFHFKCIRFVSSRSFPLQLITKSKKNTTKTRKNHTRITSSSLSLQLLSSLSLWAIRPLLRPSWFQVVLFRLKLKHSKWPGVCIIPFVKANIARTVTVSLNAATCDHERVCFYAFAFGCRSSAWRLRWLCLRSFGICQAVAKKARYTQCTQAGQKLAPSLVARQVMRRSRMPAVLPAVAWSLWPLVWQQLEWQVTGFWKATRLLLRAYDIYCFWLFFIVLQWTKPTKP